jgi:hypothetical protein
MIDSELPVDAGARRAPLGVVAGRSSGWAPLPARRRRSSGDPARHPRGGYSESII